MFTVFNFTQPHSLTRVKICKQFLWKTCDPNWGSYVNFVSFKPESYIQWFIRSLDVKKAQFKLKLSQNYVCLVKKTVTSGVKTITAKIVVVMSQ